MIKNNNFITGMKYLYLLVFYALLSGMFYPIINKQYPDKVFNGIMILWIGLAGILLIYKGAKESGNNKMRYLIFGSVITFGDLFFIFAATGKFG